MTSPATAASGGAPLGGDPSAYVGQDPSGGNGGADGPLLHPTGPAASKKRRQAESDHVSE